jgi:chemotaxis protein histidine kinase CheA
VATEGDKAIKESQLVLDKLVSQRDGLKNSINAIDKTASDKSKADAKADADDKAKIDEEYRLSNLTAEEKSFNDFYELQKKYYDNKNITKEEFEKRLAERQEEIDNNKLEAAIIAELKETLASIDNAQFEADEKARIEAEGIEKSKAARQTETTAKLAQAQEVVNKLQRISDLAFSVKFAYMKKGAKDEEAVLRAQFKINKALQLSTAIISGISATMNAFNNGMKNPVPLLGPATAAVYAIGAAIMSAAQIAKIAATQFDTSSVSGGGGGGGGGVGGGGTDLNTGAATATSNSQPSTLLNPDGTVANQNTPTPAPIQVYVVESDITSKQTQVAVVQNQMNFQ